VAHQSGRPRKAGDRREVARIGSWPKDRVRRGDCADPGQLARNARTGAVRNRRWPDHRSASGSSGWPGCGVARGIDADLQVGRSSPDAAGDHPGGKPRVRGARGLGREHGRRRWWDVRHRRREALIGDGDDLCRGAVSPEGAALTTGRALVALLGVARFVQVPVLHSTSLRSTALGGRSPLRAAARLALSALALAVVRAVSRLRTPTARPEDIYQKSRGHAGSAASTRPG
jgi:hypothetical protein